ncbi:squalene synthase HpnC [bacterium]|nr:squalene synthase HpnC [bacterium]
MIEIDEDGKRSLQDAEKYCRSFAGHYENFTVGSLLFPKSKRTDLTNIYAFCRFSDDLGDEGEVDTTEGRINARHALDVWEEDLIRCYESSPRHPILTALQRTIRKHNLPSQLFCDLISAFRQDQSVLRYETFDELLDYCRRSADPVGRIYLMLFNLRDEELFRLSDKICTALQLTNFWQDAARDLNKGRIYIPSEDMKNFGLTEADLHEFKDKPEFKSLIRFEVERTWRMFAEGSELDGRLPKRLAFEVRLFRLGGESILNKIKKIDYEVLTKRPVLSKGQKGMIFMKTLFSGGGIGIQA